MLSKRIAQKYRIVAADLPPPLLPVLLYLVLWGACLLYPERATAVRNIVIPAYVVLYVRSIHKVFVRLGVKGHVSDWA